MEAHIYEQTHPSMLIKWVLPLPQKLLYLSEDLKAYHAHHQNIPSITDLELSAATMALGSQPAIFMAYSLCRDAQVRLWQTRVVKSRVFFKKYIFFLNVSPGDWGGGSCRLWGSKPPAPGAPAEAGNPASMYGSEGKRSKTSGMSLGRAGGGGTFLTGKLVQDQSAGLRPGRGPGDSFEWKGQKGREAGRRGRSGAAGQWRSESESAPTEAEGARLARSRARALESSAPGARPDLSPLECRTLPRAGRLLGPHKASAQGGREPLRGLRLRTEAEDAVTRL